MCGICGAIDLAHAPIEPGGVRAMLDALTHRGPDSWGLIEAPGTTAGIRRLRVIDLATGDQPIRNEDGQVEVVFNGEIYNHAALREELTAAGHRFTTQSDTEVLVHLWEDRGPLRDLASSRLDERALARWPGLAAKEAAGMFSRHLSGAEDLGLPLFNMLSIGLFLERHDA